MLKRRPLNARNNANSATSSSNTSSESSEMAAEATIQTENTKQTLPIEGTTIWLRAAANGQLKSMQLLYRNGSEKITQECDLAGNTALLHAAYHGKINIIDYFLSKNWANINEQNYSGDNILTMAALGARENVFDYFERQGEHYLLNLLQHRNFFGHSVLSAALTVINNPCINRILSIQKFVTHKDLFIAILHKQPYTVINRLINGLVHVNEFKNVFELLQEHAYIPSSMRSHKTFNIAVFSESTAINNQFLKNLFNSENKRIYPNMTFQHCETSLGEYKLHSLVEKALCTNQKSPQGQIKLKQQLGVFATEEETLLPLVFHYNANDCNFNDVKKWPNMNFDVIIININPHDSIEKVNALKKKIESYYSNAPKILFNDQTNTKQTLLNTAINMGLEREQKIMHEREINRYTPRRVLNKFGRLISSEASNYTLNIRFPAAIAQGELHNYVIENMLPNIAANQSHSLNHRLYKSYCKVENLLRHSNPEVALSKLLKNLNNLVKINRLPIHWKSIILKKISHDLDNNTFNFDNLLVNFSGLLNKGTPSHAFEKIQSILIEASRGYSEKCIANKQYYSAFSALRAALEILDVSEFYSNWFNFETVVKRFCYDIDLTATFIALCCYMLRCQEASHEELFRIKYMLNELDLQRDRYQFLDVAMEKLKHIDTNFNASRNELNHLTLHHYSFSSKTKKPILDIKLDNHESNETHIAVGYSSYDESSSSSENISESKSNSINSESYPSLSSSSSEEFFLPPLLRKSQSSNDIKMTSECHIESEANQSGKGKQPAKTPLSNAQAQTQFFSDPKKMSAVRKRLFDNSMHNLDDQADHHWYTDHEITTLIGHYINNISDVVCFEPLLVNFHNALRDSLAQFHQQRSNKLARGMIVDNKVLIPINWQQIHWSLLYMIYPQNSITRPSIYYFDPLGAPPQSSLVNEILASHVVNNENNIINIDQRVQEDTYNCGPWVVETARAIANNGAIPENNFDIHNARIEHASVLNGTTLTLNSL